MALNAKKVKGTSNKTPVEPMDAGSYPARLVQVIDLGVQAQEPYNGQEKAPCQMIYTTYEFLDEFMKGEDGEPDETKPRWLSEKLPFYNLEADKAKSTLRYKSLDPNLDNDGDWSLLLGSPVLVTVVEQVAKAGPNAGKSYNRIASTTPMRAKDAAKAPELVNPTKMFSLDEPDLDVFLSLPDWLQEVIKGNLEYNGSKLEKLLSKQSKASGKKEAEVEKEEEDANEPW